MFKPLITHILQHVVSQNQWAKPHLQPYGGQVIQFDFKVSQANLQILEDGSLCSAGETAVPDATVTIPPSLAMRLLADDKDAKNYIHIDGDMALAKAVSQVLEQMHWDVEEDLSKVVGDIAAHKIVSGSKHAAQTVKAQSINAAEMLTEFWQEEAMILAKKRHVEQFNQAVDTIRDDVDRFEQRLKQFEQQLNQQGDQA